MGKETIHNAAEELVTVIVASDKENPGDSRVVGMLNGQRFELTRDEKTQVTRAQYELLKGSGRFQVYLI